MNTSLACDLNANDVAITVVGPATLDMNGYTLDCVDQETDGISLEGSGAKLKNGAVEFCNDAITVWGTGGHQINNIIVEQSVWGFTVVSDGNKISDSGAQLTNVGFLLLGSSNKLSNNMTHQCDTHFESRGSANQFKGNLASGPGTTGFLLTGTSSGNRFSGNIAAGPLAGFNIDGTAHSLKKNSVGGGANGFAIASDDTKLSKNRTVGIDQWGMVTQGDGITASGNTILGTDDIGLYAAPGTTNSRFKKNVVLGSSTDDLVDDTACASNDWSGNISDPTKSDPCTTQ
jgi:hypothetical protein